MTKETIRSVTIRVVVGIAAALFVTWVAYRFHFNLSSATSIHLFLVTAIALRWGVVIVRPGFHQDKDFYITLPGGPMGIIWLDERRIAVGCYDANVRIYSLLFHKKQNELLEVLETYDSYLLCLAGPTHAGEFATMDSTGAVCVWTSSLFNRFTLTPPPDLPVFPFKPDI